MKMEGGITIKLKRKTNLSIYIGLIVFVLASIIIIRINDNRGKLGEISLFTNSKIQKLGKTVVIDPGHGGYDVGSIGSLGTMEKDVTLSISLKLGSVLEQKGYDVIYTRDSDKVTWPSDNKKDLAARAAISNNSNADIFISIHLNNFSDKSIKGTETYYNAVSSKGKNLAQLIQNQIIEEVKTEDRGIKTANFSVLKKVKAPSILIELGYISNKNEESSLDNSDYQDKLSEAIATGINEYFNP